MSPIGIAGPKRSGAFQRYLDSQPPERVREILKAETAYQNSHRTRDARDVAERDYEESFHGYRETAPQES